MILVLPGLIMIGYWTEFPFWTSFWICALGGILGVMYSIPLRRALVTQSDLPYPEGVACAEVLKVGGGTDAQPDAVENARAGLLAVVWGSIVSAGFALLVGTPILPSDLWTLAKLIRPGYGGLLSTLAASRARGASDPQASPSTDRDIPLGMVGLLMLVCLAPVGVLLASFDSGGVLSGHMTTLVIGGLI